MSLPRRAKTLLRRAADGLLSHAGLALVRGEQVSRPSLPGVLRQVRNQGVVPGTVIDVGAASGNWSAECHGVFPGARYLLVEPLEEFAGLLRGRVRSLGPLGSGAFIPAVASGEDGERAFNVHEDLFGSSLLREAESGVDGVERTVRSVTVDTLVREAGAPGPYLLKVDVQGAELDVLAGATVTLESAALVVLEVSFFNFHAGGPQFHDVVSHMKQAGFVVYDLFGLAYRPLDGALAQADVVFAPEDGPLRARHEFASPEQRARQNAALQTVYEQRRSSGDG